LDIRGQDGFNRQFSLSANSISLPPSSPAEAVPLPDCADAHRGLTLCPALSRLLSTMHWSTGCIFQCSARRSMLRWRWRCIVHWRRMPPIYINGDEVEMVESFKSLGVQITNNLPWSLLADAIVKKVPPTPLRRLRKFGHVRYDSHQPLQMHHRKHPFQMYHSLVWLLLCPRLQST